MDTASVSMNTARASMDTVGESMDAMGAVMNGNVNQEKKKTLIPQHYYQLNFLST